MDRVAGCTSGSELSIIFYQKLLNQLSHWYSGSSFGRWIHTIATWWYWVVITLMQSDFAVCSARAAFWPIHMRLEAMQQSAFITIRRVRSACLCPDVLTNVQPASPTAEFICCKVLIVVHNSCIAAAHEWRLHPEISPVDCLRTRLSCVCQASQGMGSVELQIIHKILNSTGILISLVGRAAQVMSKCVWAGSCLPALTRHVGWFSWLQWALVSIRMSLCLRGVTLSTSDLQERGAGVRQPVTGAAKDLKGHAVCRSTSRSTPRGNLMFLPAYKSKQICNHQALAPGLGHQRYN